jgi:hypothetical protein
MTVIKYINSTPHIVRFGSTNDNPAKSELQLWRNGKHFVIVADHNDVRGTEFERQWLPLLNPEPMTSLASRWSELCDLVISSCLEMLQGLAPDTEYWSTLYDYLHVESYTLKLQSRASASASASGVDLDVVVHEGPTSDTCAYELQPTAWITFSIPNVLPVFESQRVIPLDHEQDLKGPPRKAQLPDGKVTFFVPCKASIRPFDSTTIMNGSAQVTSLHQLLKDFYFRQSINLHHFDIRTILESKQNHFIRDIKLYLFPIFTIMTLFLLSGLSYALSCDNAYALHYFMRYDALGIQTDFFAVRIRIMILEITAAVTMVVVTSITRKIHIIPATLLVCQFRVLRDIPCW